jgi:hypothetical protein
MEIEIILSAALGLGLAAACGFRIFVPFLIASIAARSGHLELAGSFEWIASTPALVSFAVATVLEVAAYYVPWVDNLLDTVASPTAVVAGILATASVVTDVSPWMQWGIAALGGGTVAGVVQAISVTGRGLSSVTTLGFGNPVVSTGEAVGAGVMSVLAVVVPLLAFILVVALVGFGLYRFLVHRARRVSTA